MLRYDRVIKVSFFGAEDAGKTSIAKRFANNEFSVSFIAGLGNDVYIRDHERVRFKLIDWKVSLKDRRLHENHYNTHVFVIVYDCTNESSFEEAKKWLTKLRELNGESREVSYVLVGNKSDLVSEKIILQEMAAKFAEEEGIPFVECSAKTGANIEEILLGDIKAAKKANYDCFEKGCASLQDEIRKYHDKLQSRCLKPSPKRQASIDLLNDEIAPLLEKEKKYDIETMKKAIALIKGHQAATLRDHTSGWFGFIGSLFTNSDLAVAYGNALKSFPQELVKKTPAAEVDLSLAKKFVLGQKNK